MILTFFLAADDVEHDLRKKLDPDGKVGNSCRSVTKTAPHVEPLKLT